jgi:hypothetical protein
MLRRSNSPQAQPVGWETTSQPVLPSGVPSFLALPHLNLGWYHGVEKISAAVSPDLSWFVVAGRAAAPGPKSSHNSDWKEARPGFLTELPLGSPVTFGDSRAVSNRSKRSHGVLR